MSKKKRTSNAAPADTGPRELPDKKTIKEARRFLKETARLLKKNKKKVSDVGRQRVEAAMKGVEDGLDPASGSQKRLSTAIKELDRTVDDVLGFAKKSSLREFVDSIVVAVAIAGLLRAFVIEAFKIPSGSMIPTLEVGDHIFVNKFIYGLRVPFTNAWFVEWGTPQRGDVIVFRYPLEPSKDYIKRVVAVSGDRVRVDGEKVFLNDVLLERAEPEKIKYFEDAEPGAPAPFPVLREAFAYPERSQGEESKLYTVLYEPRAIRRLAVPSGKPLPGLECVFEEPGRKSECKIQEGYVFVMGDNRDNSSDSRVWGGVPKSYVLGKALFIWWSRGQKAGFRMERIGQPVH